MSKHKKTPNYKNAEGNKEPNNRNIYIEGRVEVDIVKNLKDQRDAERAEDKATAKRQFFWTITTVILVFCYTAFSAWQVKIAKDTFNAANRPYVGVEAIHFSHVKLDANGQFQQVDRRNPQANAMNINLVIKNFGPIPGTKYKATWKMSIGGIEQKVTKKVPDVPSTIFPTQTFGMIASIREDYYNAIINGTKTLIIDAVIEYDGPSGHYKETNRQQYAPDVDNFYALGPIPE